MLQVEDSSEFDTVSLTSFDFTADSDDENLCTKQAAAQLNVSRAFVEPIWKSLAARANVPSEQDKSEITIEHNFHIEIEGDFTINPTRIRCNRYIFALPPEVQIIYLCSNTWIPSKDIGPFVDDRRQLGVLVGEIHLYTPHDVETIDVCTFLTHARGWHDVEASGCRWTSGRGVLPVSQAIHYAAPRVLSIQILSGASP